MPPPVLKVNNLTKVFNDQKVVDHVTFEVNKNEVVGLLGVNGAGKTTTMQMILGLIEPTEGSVEIFGEDFRQNPIKTFQRINFSSAYISLPSNLRVWENMRIFSKIYRVSRWQEKAEELLDLFEISYAKERITGHLSSGETARVSLCKGLLNSPELLFLDEATASMDPNIADKVRKIIRKIQKDTGMSILYTSHNMRDIEEVCDRVFFLHEGKKIAEGTPQGVMAHFKQNSLEEVFIRVARNELHIN